MAANTNTQPIIFKKYEIVEGGGHHGGGWKVAYADFMTAMMAFFLLMWILASSDEQKLSGIAEYFTNATQPGGIGVLDGATLGPPGTLTASNGSVVARGSELGKIDDPSPAQWEVRDTTPTSDPQEKVFGTREGEHDHPAGGAEQKEFQKEGETPATGSTTGSASGAAQSDIDAEHAKDDMRFEELQKDILQAMQQNPDLDPLTQNVIFEKTPDGLHIQIIDQAGQPMFHSGQAEMAGATNLLLSNLGHSLAGLPNHIIVEGHTDSVRFANGDKYDNWDLSSDRANATRRVFENAGVSQDRIIRVSGMADTQPLVPENPEDPSNRRISVLVRYQDIATAAPSGTSQGHAGPEASAATHAAPSAQEASDHGTGQATQHATAHAEPPAKPIGDQVFLNLRNALR